MKLRTVIALSVCTALVVVSGFTSGFALRAHPATDSGARYLEVSKGEPQSGDDRGGDGRDLIAKGEPQPGDDRGRDGGINA